MRGSRPATFLKGDSNTGAFLWMLQKNFKNTYFDQNLRTTSAVSASTVNIFPWVLISALNSIGLLQRTSSRFKEFSLGCLVVGSSLTWKKRKISWNGHSLSFVVPRCTTRLSFYKRSKYSNTMLSICKISQI